MNNSSVNAVVATLLLTIIVVVASIITYLWVSGFQAEAQKSSQTQSIGEILKIDGVEVEQSKLIIYVRNLGSHAVTVDSVIILKKGNMVDVLTPVGAPVTIAAGELKELVVYPTTDIEGNVGIRVGTAEATSTTYSTVISLKVKRLVINEVELDPYTGNEWIELYNPSNESVDLRGYRIYDKIPGNYICTIGSSCTASTTILAPHSYLKVAWSGGVPK